MGLRFWTILCQSLYCGQLWVLDRYSDYWGGAEQRWWELHGSHRLCWGLLWAWASVLCVGEGVECGVEFKEDLLEMLQMPEEEEKRIEEEKHIEGEK